MVRVEDQGLPPRGPCGAKVERPYIIGNPVSGPSKEDVHHVVHIKDCAMVGASSGCAMRAIWSIKECVSMVIWDEEKQFI
eukprot:3244140-Prymnesium_polylepis.1